MAQVYGYNGVLLMKAASSIDALPSGNWIKAPFLPGTDYGATRPLLEDDHMSGANQTPEERDPQVDGKTIGGRVNVPLDLRLSGWWLRAALGAPTTTGTGPYTHTFKSNATALSLLALEFQHPGVSKFFQSVAVVEGFELGLSRAEWANVSVQLRGKDETRAGSTAGGTPTTPAVTRFVNRQLSIKKDGSALAKVVGGAIRFANGLEEVPGLGAAGLVESFDPAMRYVSGTLDLRFDSMTFLDAADARTAMALEVAWTIDADNKITFTLPRVFLEPAKPAIQGRGGVQVGYAYRAVRDATEGCALKAVLVNDVSSYA